MGPKVASCLITEQLYVPRRMHLLENLEIALEITDRFREVIGLLGDFALIRL